MIAKAGAAASDIQPAAITGETPGSLLMKSFMVLSVGARSSG